MTAPRIIVAGSANIDLVTRVPRSPKPGESILGHSFATVTGGKGANQALAAARLGAQVSFAGCVGADAFGALQRETLSADGVDCAQLKTHPTEPTGTAVILVADEGQNSIVITPSANYGLRPEDIAPLDTLFAQADAVLVQLEIPLDTVAAVLEKARQAGVLSILDAGPAQKVDPALVALADIVSPNETEAETMTGVPVSTLDGAREAARALLAMGARQAVMKLGAQGALFLDAREEIYVPAFTVPVVDTTAAGDAFTAALAVAWSSHGHAEALRFANAAGALAATVAGAQPSMPRRAAVDAFLKERA